MSNFVSRFQESVSRRDLRSTFQVGKVLRIPSIQRRSHWPRLMSKPAGGGGAGGVGNVFVAPGRVVANVCILGDDHSPGDW
jgi:hypothetical protein